MRLIVDSGSTKTDWIAIDDSGNILFETQTLGLNPQVLSEAIVEERVINNYELYRIRNEVDSTYFYGAGCGTEPPRKLMEGVLKSIFQNSKISVKEDTYAAVYSITDPGEPSIVCILGTGSNCSFYDGEIVHQKITSLGYILMDDASGNYFGRQLLRDYYFNKIPKALSDSFAEEFNLGAEEIKTNLYKKSNPNTYLATFAKFVIVNKNEPYMQGLIDKGLGLFIENQITQFDNAKEVSVHFIGSISYFLKEELEAKLISCGLTLGRVLKKPIEGLVSYHQSTD
ncbi:MAG: N-acetylglucosamine kinase [Flavobacteriaceae bacterium TMED81]|jgi:N-acetylglucosamine kinase-like BadF-type ATPase|nr:MAG: N-acetylglucosamine kinase [Flavobacteriaceae bacterium TMED81]|tara:strand:- start:446 stop:1297 length:852 start_codon:yes stop_codon:yes gene_type:complete